MDAKSVVDLIESSSGVHFSGFHMDALEKINAGTEAPTTSATDHMYNQPFVIGVFLQDWQSVLSLNQPTTCFGLEK